MTNIKLWEKLDNAALNSNHLASTMELSVLLKQAYDEDLDLIIGCFYSFDNPKTAHQSYFDIDGQRMMVCFTSKKEARKDNGNPDYGIAKARDVMNNMFNKSVIMGIVFNPHSEDKFGIVFKDILNDLMPGDKPKPPNFVDSK